MSEKLYGVYQFYPGDFAPILTGVYTFHPPLKEFVHLFFTAQVKQASVVYTLYTVFGLVLFGVWER